MSDSDHSLDQLLGPLRKPARPGGSQEETGLNPFDLLALPDDQRDLLNWLSRRKQARFNDIQAALSLDNGQLLALLSDLKQANYVNEALIEGEVYYRVVFSGKPSRAARALPDDIWARIDQDYTSFLKEVPLFRQLPDDLLRDVAQKLTSRQFGRNEVILWQGGLPPGLYFIKSGIVGLTRLSPNTRSAQILTYFKEGDFLGEYGLLPDQNVTSAATATALSEVEVLVMQRRDVLNLFQLHPTAALEMIQMLTQRLVDQDARLSRMEQNMGTLCLVIGAVPHAGVTMLGTTLALELSQQTQLATVYTEHPQPNLLPAQFGFSPDADVFHHPGGYDVLVPRGVDGLPPSVRITLVLERLAGLYSNIVIGVSGRVDASVIYMLERAEQVILIAPPDPLAWDQLESLREQLQKIIRPEKTSLFTICNRLTSQHRLMPLPSKSDFEIPCLDVLPSLAQRISEALPASLSSLSSALIEQLGHANLINIYIPVSAAPNDEVKTMVDQVLDFLNQQFGGPASRSHVGYIGESTYVVRTYAAKADIDRNLNKVLDYLSRLKMKFGQDVMAIEVNQKAMLV